MTCMETSIELVKKKLLLKRQFLRFWSNFYQSNRTSKEEKKYGETRQGLRNEKQKDIN